jgi:hypothetical protein
LFPLFATGVIDNGGKFAAVVVDTGGKFCHRHQQYRRNWWQNLLPVSLIPVANLSPVSLKPVASLWPVSLTPVANLPPVSLIQVWHLDLPISLRIFEKIRNSPNGILWGWGKLIHEKDQSKKSRDTVPLSQERQKVKSSLNHKKGQCQKGLNKIFKLIVLVFSYFF